VSVPFATSSTMLFLLFWCLVFLDRVVVPVCIQNATDPYRLPSSVIPESYFLALTPNFNELYIDGQVIINVQIQVATQCIFIHAVNIDFDAVSFRANSVQYLPSSVNFDYEKQWAQLFFPQNLPTGPGLLSINFTSYINTENATGFFRSPATFNVSKLLSKRSYIIRHFGSYENFLASKQMKRTRIPRVYHLEHNEYDDSEPPVSRLGDDNSEVVIQQNNWMYATQFEGPYARRAFPVFDEPALKAKFEAQITVPENYTALFNTKELSVTHQKGMKIYRFEQTPVPMSSYLVAFAIGRFDYQEKVSRGIRYRVYTPAGYAYLTSFSLDLSVKAIEYFSDLWNFDYVFNKLDNIAVPAIVEDAMENWGLVTYDPSFLLIDLSTSDQLHKDFVAQVVTHELSHQWFGNTITAPWWSQLYLQEGFARYLQYTGVDFIYPKWDIFTHSGQYSFFNFAYILSMNVDYLGVLGPVVKRDSDIIGTASSVMSMFNIITYGKGASLNRMFNIFLGNELWNEALTRQVAKYAFTNPSVTDLLNTFDSVFSSASQRFRSWFYQPGFPVVTIRLVDTKRGTFVLSQHPVTPFVTDGKSGNQTWWIPLLIQFVPMKGPSFYYNMSFDSPQTTFSINKDISGYLVKGNANYTGYFLMNYEPSLWTPILKQATDFLSPIDYYERQMLAYHIMTLAQTSHVRLLTVPLQFASYLADNRAFDTNIWPFFIKLTETILPSILASNKSTIENFRKQFGSVLYNVVDKLGWYIYSPTIAVIREPVAGVLIQLNNTKAIERLLDLWAKRGTFNIPQDLKYPVYYTLVRYNGTEGYNAVYALLNASFSQRSIEALKAVMMPPKSSLCSRTLAFLNNTPMKPLDIVANLRPMLANNPECQDVAWNWIKSNSPQLLQSGGANAASVILNTIQGAFSTIDKLHQVTAYLNSFRHYFTQQQIATTLTQLQLNINMINYN